ncbi:MAG TPA: methylmalonyl-CoA mutase subunit beta [Beijerinckia sp.]|jgi:methylmalonyl-CoA mutase|nr:methylmalonyl-CoA mutase subunit beta [Beijerinckia sp.]
MSNADSKATDLFPPGDEASWRKLVNDVLKGGSFEKLVSTTFEGLRIEPLYPRASLETGRALRQKQGPWQISQRMDHPDVEAANAIALHDLENGADSLTLTIDETPAAHGFGVKIENGRDLDRALQNIELDLISLRLDAGERTLALAGDFQALAKERRLTSASLDLDFGYDPAGSFARSGSLSASPAEIGTEAAQMARILRDGGFTGHLSQADARPYHEAGAGEAQELGAVLATGVQYLRLLEAGGLSLEEARDEIAFLLVADADEFMSLAKFRALRQLWARIEAACGLAPKPIRLHAETAFRMATKRDPWVNILRATVAVFSAGLGGADAITVLPFTLALGLPDELARRIARNTQLLLLHESHLAKVADPAAGAGGFEALTEALCEKAWAFFQDIERAGGIIEALKTGLPQKVIAETAEKRHAAIAKREQPITGTSEFPNLAEAPVRVLIPAPSAKSASAAPGSLPSRRDAESFEALRDASDETFARTGTRPKVFLANLGPISAFMGRSIFAKNLFEAAGIEAMTNDGFATPAEAAGAFLAAQSKIACICSSNAIYAQEAAATAQALRAAGAQSIYLAGSPGEHEKAWREAGVNEFVFAGCDVLITLERALASAA